MAFDSGSVSFRLFYLQQQYDSGLIDAFSKHVAPPIESLNRDPIRGWVTWRHLFDRALTDETCVIGPYLHAQWMQAEKKVPPALLRAYVKMEEDTECRARETEFLPRAARAEIKQRVTEALLPKMPPTLASIPVVVDFRNDLLVAAALSDKQIDTLSPAFKETAGTLPILLTPETAALRRRQVNANDLDPVSFSPDPALEPPNEATLGMDFFTWLWFAWEKEGGVCHLPDGREFGVMLEGPLTFYREGQGAHEAVLRKGSPLNSREAGTALLCGKKLKRAKVVIAQGDDVFSATVDADFAFRSLKLPKGEQTEAAGRFEERMLMIETFWSAWLALFDRFLDLRTDAQAWPKTLDAMRQWIARFGEA
ncbi:MAG TPA: recombination-associated protein RdgC [Kiritimatiellia bacterium]|nr:recombination-associated protein RdgC [Kiritimatiellia bacterium]HRU70176.1 recombination-associated protein RdgC [Kiritimatiellia bacterium]